MIDDALTASHESAIVDFKREFHASSPSDWCELIKDIVAMANSGGGLILIGVNDDGTSSGCDISSALDMDPADITNRIYKYTDVQFAGFEVAELQRNGQPVAALAISRVSFVPIAFTKPGTYPIEGGRQKTAFSAGTVYFRHGAKSEPCSSEDLRQFIEQEIAIRREAWLGNIRKVVEAPPGSQVAVVPPSGTPSTIDPSGTHIRLVDDPSAPALGFLHPDASHPHRLIDVVRVVNEKSGGKVKINSFDIQCVRQRYGIDGNPTFFYRMKFTSPRYSDAFVEWLLQRSAEEPGFFTRVRTECRGQSAV